MRIFAANRAITKLTHELPDSETGSFDVVDGSAFPAEGNFFVSIDNEIILLSGRDGNTFHIAANGRGADNTETATHEAESQVANKIVAGYINNINDYLEYKVTEEIDGLKDDLGDVAYADLIEAAQLGETIISGGFINTNMIRIDGMTEFAEGFSPLEKVDQDDVGQVAYYESVEQAMKDETIIVGGFIKTSMIHIGSDVNFDSGYDPSEKETPAGASSKATSARNEARNDLANRLGYDNYSDMMSQVTSYGTIIDDGYIRTGLIKAGSIYSDLLDTDLMIANCSFTSSLDVSCDTVLGHNFNSPRSGSSVNSSFGGVFIPDQMDSSPWDGIINRGGPSGSVGARWKFDNHCYLRQDSSVFRVTFSGGTAFIAEDGGYCRVYDDLQVDGELFKSSGNFLIDHPLEPEEKDLYHGFVEAPRYDLIYRGKIALQNGEAEVDIDEASNMSKGTFDKLTQNAEVMFLNNLDSFDRVKSKPIEKGKFKIICENSESNNEVAWAVMAERADDFIMDSKRTDDQGQLIPEVEKEEAPDLSYDKEINLEQEQKGKKGYCRHKKEVR